MEGEDLQRFLRTLRERAQWITLVVVIAVGSAVVYVTATDEVYEAQADIQVTPIPDQGTVLASLGLITESVDPTLDVQTATQLIDGEAVAARAVRTLDGPDASTDIRARAKELAEDVEVKPVGQSNVIAVVARRGDAEGAARLANVYAESAVALRNAELRQQIRELLPKLRKQRSGEPEGSPAEQGLGEDLALLEGLRASGDPTLRLENLAAPPTEPDWPRPLLTVVLALVLGLALAVTAAYLIQLLDPRLRREEQLHSRYRIPVLARIPKQPGRRGKDNPMMWEELSPGAIEAYRTLRANLVGPTGLGGLRRSILVTGSTPSEGKTTTAINLAAALGRSGASTILIEADLRRPTIGKALGVTPGQGLISVLSGECSIEEGLSTSSKMGANLKLLLTERSGIGLEELLSFPATAERLLSEAESLADYVVIDSAPLTEVIDALPLARRAASVLVVARLNSSPLKRISALAELLEENDIRPSGFALIGVPNQRQSSYYYHRQSGHAPDEVEPEGGEEGPGRP